MNFYAQDNTVPFSLLLLIFLTCLSSSYFIVAGEYTVTVTTGKEADMATQNKVVLVAYGNKDVSREVELGQGHECFGAGVTHEMKVNFECDLGELYKVRACLCRL